MPGISVKKVLSDLFLFAALLKLLWQHRHNQYQLIHAVEESAFLALLVKSIFGLPYVYDMDSFLSRQLLNRWTWLKPLQGLLERLECLVARKSLVVIAVCHSLVESALAMGARRVFLLSDVSLLELDPRNKTHFDLRKNCSINKSELVVLYVGNLEPYQGIDLLLCSFAICLKQNPDAHLVIVGGRKEHIDAYKKECISMKIQTNVHFVEPKPIEMLGDILAQADILVSPRISGVNTPMKIYSYLHAGKALVATSLETHSQILDESVCRLAAPNAEAFAEALEEMLNNALLRKSIGERARSLAEKTFTLAAFSQALNNIYDQIDQIYQQAAPELPLS